MGPKEPTKHQLSSRLTYSQNTPAFLQKLQNRIAGVPDEEVEEYEWDGTGRPPIPQRPAIPERPEDDPGSADEDEGDEKPQVVVLREGKHLTEREAENIRRKERGLPPLPDPKDAPKIKSDDFSLDAIPKDKTHATALSFSSGLSSLKGKRKAVGDPVDDMDAAKSKPTKKKSKKAGKALLSFGDGNDP